MKTVDKKIMLRMEMKKKRWPECSPESRNSLMLLADGDLLEEIHSTAETIGLAVIGMRELAQEIVGESRFEGLISTCRRLSDLTQEIWDRDSYEQGSDISSAE